LLTDMADEGGYFDEAGTWIDTTGVGEGGEGGYYDADGTWIDARDAPEDKVAVEGGYYDEAGAWVDASGEAAAAGGVEAGEGFYDEWGNWVEPGLAEDDAAAGGGESGYYDEWGAWVDTSAYVTLELAAASPPAAAPMSAWGAPSATSSGGGSGSGGVNIEVAFKLEQTALFAACERRDEDTVLALLEAAYAEPGAPGTNAFAQRSSPNTFAPHCSHFVCWQ
jgi:hypothetical protein